ncbi:MAG: hypothetical protein Q9209_000966 [Squamulea sp. 1 TL-2023]
MAPPPPPATPNPYRFAPSKQPKPPTSLGSQQHQTPQGGLSRQFAPTPRFSFSSTQRTQNSNTAAEIGHSSSPIVPRQPPRFHHPNLARKKDEIEDAASDEEGEDQNHKPTSHGHRKSGEVIEEAPSPTSTPLPNKRRRLDAISISSSPSPSPPHSSSSPQVNTSPQTYPSSPLHLTAHTQPFILSPKRPPSTPFPNASARPPFVLPPRSPSPPLANLHPIFSPHRRGGPKFLPGGMAATVRDWVVDVAANVPATKAGEWDMRFRVGEVRGGERVTLVEEMEPSKEREERKRWMLVGNNGQVSRGVMVGIRRPVWDVDVQGETWGVGVDWGLLDG